MSIRRAVLADLPAIVELAVESVSKDPLPVTVDRDGMRETGRAMIGHPSHFVWVGEDDGQVNACVAAVVQKGFWFRGTQCSVLLFYARKPGDGAALLMRLASWIKSRPSIKIAVFELEPGVDPRIERVLDKVGFSRKSNNITYVRSPSP
jgi:hypothetical protein